MRNHPDIQAFRAKAKIQRCTSMQHYTHNMPTARSLNLVECKQLFDLITVIGNQIDGQSWNYGNSPMSREIFYELVRRINLL
tara:strand:+ start:171 stop:416 length:246 start_codon:yes stop_codon:yes gene_type:complete